MRLVEGVALEKFSISGLRVTHNLPQWRHSQELHSDWVASRRVQRSQIRFAVEFHPVDKPIPNPSRISEIGASSFINIEFPKTVEEVCSSRRPTLDSVTRETIDIDIRYTTELSSPNVPSGVV